MHLEKAIFFLFENYALLAVVLHHVALREARALQFGLVNPRLAADIVV